MNYQPLFNKLADLGYLETESEMYEIILAVKECEKGTPFESKTEIVTSDECLPVLIKWDGNLLTTTIRANRITYTCIEVRELTDFLNQLELEETKP